MTTRPHARTSLALAAALGAAGCNALLGIEDRPPRRDAGALDDAASRDGAPPDGPSSDGAARGDAGAYPSAVLADAPLLYLRFGEPTGTVARDEMRAFDGTYPTAGASLGAPGALAGDPDTAVDLDGTTAIKMPPGADFDPARAFSVEIWLKPRAASSLSFIVDHQTYAAIRDGWLLAYGDAAIFERWAGGANGGSAVSNGPLSLGAWHHLVGTYDGAPGGVARLWVDGAVVGTTTNTVTIPKVPEGWSIGAQNCDCTGRSTVGTLDELAVYDHVLTQDRILAHFAAAH